jgi:HEAT repeat protein
VWDAVKMVLFKFVQKEQSMKKMPIRFSTSVFMLIILSSSLLSQSMIPNDKLASLKLFDFGQDRSLLIEIEELVNLKSSDIVASRFMAQELADLLTLESSYACKQFVCRQLAIIGTENQVPILASLLADEQLADMARYALVRIDLPSVDKALLKALSKTSGHVQIGIINSLGTRRYVGATRKLGRLLFSIDTNVANAAALALGQIGGTRAGAVLKKAFSENNPERMLAVSDAYLMCAEHFIEDGDLDQATKIYLYLFENSKIVSSKAAALKGLLSVNHPDAFQFLISTLKQEHPDAQRNAASFASDLTGEEQTAALVELLPGLAPEIQIALISTLIERGDKAALPAIENLAADRNRYVRSAAIKALGALGNESFIIPLAESAINTTGREKEAAQQSLYVLQGEFVDSTILSLIEKSDPKVQVELISSLAERQTPNAFESLMRVVDSEDPKVRRAAILSMRELAHKENLSDMIQLALRMRSSEQGLAENAVVKTAKRTDAVKMCTNQVIKLYQENDVLDQKASMLRILGGLSHKNALPLMRETLRTGDDLLKVEILRSFAEWPTADPLPDLYNVAEKSENETFALLALRGIIELIDLDSSLSKDQQLEMYKKAMDMAGQNEEKRRIFSKLSGRKTFAAMNYAARFMDDPALKEEAGLAVMSIAAEIYPQNTGIIKPVIRRVRESTDNDLLKTQASNLLSKTIKNYETEIKKQGLASTKELKKEVPFQLRVINSESDYEAGSIFDVNRDGKLDIYCGGFWYEAPDWKKHFVRDVPGDGGYYYDFAAVPQDVDNDGWTDIVNGSWHGKDVFWIRNPGVSAKPFEVFNIDKPGNLETLIGVDINGDGQLDFLPNTVRSMVWYEYKQVQQSEQVRWIKHTLPAESAGHGVGAGDVNSDGKMDIITPKGWLEQTTPSDDAWIWHPEFQLPGASVPVLAHDVDKDGDSDIIVGNGHGYGVYWLEQQNNATGQRTWIKHVIDDTWSQAHFLILADLDLDGQKELITGKRRYAHNGHDKGGEHPVCVYYYRYHQTESTWTRHVIHEGGQVGFGIYTDAKDIDNDGDIDVLCPGKSGLFLMENLLK